jgi:hypothetical protein
MDEKTVSFWKLRIVKRTALDGKTWWTILGIYNNFPACTVFKKYYFGKYPTRKQARAALTILDPETTLHSLWR